MFDSRRKFIHQALLATAGLMLPYKKGTALNLSKKRFALDTYHPKDCTIDLSTYYKYDLATEIQIDDDQSYAKDPMVHKDVMYAAEVGDGNGCDPSVNSCGFYDISGENSLRYQVYYPKKTVHDYETVRLPAVVLFHAGGFAECTDYQLPIMKKLCEKLSRKGFITFSVEYRRGKVEDDLTKYTSVQSQLALYRAQQDGRGFIRSILKKQTQGLNHNNWKYLIDNTNFLLGVLVPVG